MKVILLVDLNIGGVMKKYLFGLGAMLVGAGLMFVLMYGEVNAEDMKKIKCESFETGQGDFTLCKVHRRSSPDFIKEDQTCVLVHAPTFTL